MNYQRLSEEFEKSQCKLLTTEEEMKILTKTKQFQHTNVRILAACGHEHQCVVTNFLVRRTANLCKDCRKILVINTHKDWMEEFKYDYKNVDESKLKSQFGY